MKKASDKIDSALTLWRIFTRTQYLIQKIRQRELNEDKIPLRSSAVIGSIVRLGKRANITTLKEETLLEPHTISEHLKRLEKQGLIKKVKSKNGREIVRIEVTEAGIEVHNKIIKRKAIYHIMSALTREEQRELLLLLEKLEDKTLEYLRIDTAYRYHDGNSMELTD
jgi:DNA-binding MarR family transcriptional regulator